MYIVCFYYRNTRKNTTYVHVRTYTNIPTYTYKHAHTYTQTHIHTHTPSGSGNSIVGGKALVLVYKMKTTYAFTFIEIYVHSYVCAKDASLTKRLQIFVLTKMSFGVMERSVSIRLTKVAIHFIFSSSFFVFIYKTIYTR